MSSPLIIVCPHCNAVNRVPADRLADRSMCGKCRQHLFTGHPLELDAASFHSHIGHSDIPLVVDFWATPGALDHRPILSSNRPSAKPETPQVFAARAVTFP